MRRIGQEAPVPLIALIQPLRGGVEGGDRGLDLIRHRGGGQARARLRKIDTLGVRGGLSYPG
jgi:hypothetical protein